MSSTRGGNPLSAAFFAIAIILALVFGGATIGYKWRGSLVPASIAIAQDEIQRGIRLIDRCQINLFKYTSAMDSIHTWLHRGVPMIDTLFITGTAKSDG